MNFIDYKPAQKMCNLRDDEGHCFQHLYQTTPNISNCEDLFFTKQQKVYTHQP